MSGQPPNPPMSNNPRQMANAVGFQGSYLFGLLEKEKEKGA
jgi:hypothetical protein